MILEIGKKYLYLDFDGRKRATTVLAVHEGAVWHKADYCFADGSSYSTDAPDYFYPLEKDDD